MPSISNCDLLFVCSLLASLTAMAQEPPRTGIPSFQGAVERILRGVEDLPAGLQPGETPTEERPEVKDCKEAVSMVSKGLMGKTNFDYDKKIVNNAPPTNITPRKYVVRGEVVFVPEVKSMTIKVPYWPNMTKEEREQVDKYRKALTVHENGHKAIADKVAKEHSKSLEGSGRTSQAAQKDFQDLVDKEHVKYRKAAQKESDSYDKITEHGIKQKDGVSRGYPDGENVFLHCPAK